MQAKMYVYGLLIPMLCTGFSHAESLLSSETEELIRKKLRVRSFSTRELILPKGESPNSLEMTVLHEGKSVALSLGKHSVRASYFQILVQRADGRFEIKPEPPVTTYRGFVKEDNGAEVAASLMPDGLSVTVVNKDGSGWAIRPVRAFQPQSPRKLHISYDLSEVASLSCGHDDEDDPDATLGFQAYSEEDQEVRRALFDVGYQEDECTITVANVAFDSDYEFYAGKFDGDEDRCIAEIEEGLNITNLIYERDVRITHKISAIILRTDPATDFYAVFPDASDFGSMLVAFKDEWNENMQHIDYDSAYYLTGKSHPEYGGLAYVRAICSQYRYGMGIGGSSYEGIYRHEVGHNWGCGHSCGTERKYVMCGNSISALSAHNIEVIKAYRESRSCLEEIPYESDPAPPYVRPDLVMRIQGQGPVAIDVLSGDTDINCERLKLMSFDSRSSFGADIEVLSPFDSHDFESLLYLPRSDFTGTDFFSYKVEDETGFAEEGIVLVKTVSPGQIAYYNFEETEGDEAEDASGHDREGDLKGGLLFETDSVPGRYGRGLKFSGIDREYVSLGKDADFDMTHQITVCAWCTVDAFAGRGEELVSKGSDAWRLKRNGAKPSLKFTCTGLSVSGSPDGNLLGTVAVDDGLWHHVAGVYDGSRIYLYVDGVLDGSLPATGFINTNSSSARIGDDEWNGTIDEVRIFNYGLDSEEIRLLYEGAMMVTVEPVDGALGVVPSAEIHWQASAAVTAHDVYFGMDYDAVYSANTTAFEYKGRKTESSYTPQTDPGRTYFWRIDEIIDGLPVKGSVRAYTCGFAYTDFSEPALDAYSFSRKRGDRELEFETSWAPTSGRDPFVGVIGTGSTVTTPVFSHRSVDALTTFESVDLSEHDESALSLRLQVRNTGYEDNDHLNIYTTNGVEEIQLLKLAREVNLSQRSGTGYETYAALLPGEWDHASLVVASSSNSSAGRERFDFDQVSFFDYNLFSVIAHTSFRELSVDAASYTPDQSGVELGFKTVQVRTGGSDPYVGVVEHKSTSKPRLLRYRSVEAETVFDTVDLQGLQNVRVAVVVRESSTGYENEDYLNIYVTNGSDRIDLINASGDGLDSLPQDEHLTVQAMVPDTWQQAALVVSSHSNSSSGSEIFDLFYVEFVRMPELD